MTCPQTARGPCPRFAVEVIPPHCRGCQQGPGNAYHDALAGGWVPFGSPATGATTPRVTPAAMLRNELAKLATIGQPVRPLSAAFDRLAICQTCDRWRGDHCGRDHGCDRRHVLVARLLRRDCKEWTGGRLERLAGRPKVVIHTHALNVGGAERWVVDLARHLDPSRVNLLAVTVSNDDGDDVLIAKACEAAPILTKPAQVRAVVNQADVIVCWSVPPPGTSRRTVFCGHGMDAWAANNLRRLGTLRDFHATAVSQAVADFLPVEADVIYNGSDPARLEPRAGRDVTRRRLGIPAGAVVVGYVGRLAAGKRPEAVNEAVMHLNRCSGCRPAVALYVGHAPKQEAATARRLGQIRPKPVFVERAEHLGDLFAAMDCFLLASPSEGFSLAMIEAWLAGVPVVSTPVGAVPELETEHGPLVVRVGVGSKAAELAAAVRRAVAADNASTVARARDLARREFTTEAMGKRWTDYLCRIAES